MLRRQRGAPPAAVAARAGAGAGPSGESSADAAAAGDDLAPAVAVARGEVTSQQVRHRGRFRLGRGADLRRCTPWTRMRRITRSTRLWLTLIPAAFSSAVMRGMP